MSKQALKRVRRALKLPVCREPLPAVAWPGGYPLYYAMPDSSTGIGVCVWCPKCANENIDSIDEELRTRRRERRNRDTFTGVDANYEDALLSCDHCGEFIDPAYLDGAELAAARAGENGNG